MGFRSKNFKILVIARATLWDDFGTMKILNRLLENFNKEEIVLLGRRVHPMNMSKNYESKHHSHQIYVPLIKGYKLWMMLSIIPGVLQGLILLRKNDIRSILCVYPDEGSLITGYLVHKISRIPLNIYFCDLYADEKTHGWQGFVANLIQPRVFKESKIFVLTEAMKDLFIEKYSIHSIVIPSVIANIPSKPPILKDKNFTHTNFIIGYCGSINEARIDTMRYFFEAIERLSSGIDVRLFSRVSREFLVANNLEFPFVKLHFTESTEELVSELHSCDLLYLPLSFNVNSMESPQLRTCFGTKIIDYLKAQKPILAHGPSDYYSVEFFRINSCGYTLSSVNANTIKVFIKDLLDSYVEKSQDLIESADEHSKKYFSSERITSLLRSEIYSNVL